MTPIYIQAIGTVCALGQDQQQIKQNLLRGVSPGLIKREQALYSGRRATIAKIPGELPPVSSELKDFDNRNNRLAELAFRQIEPQLEKLRRAKTDLRIGVVIGTSTSGIESTEASMRQRVQNGCFEDGFRLDHLTIGDTANFVARLCDAKGPAYSVSTACSSAGRTFISAAALLHADAVDVVICGGVDSLCDLTLNGFDALEQVSENQSRPFDKDRNGINIGEAAGLFVLSKQLGPWRLLGYGESAEGHHMSAPMPCGSGAKAAMEDALENAGLAARDVGYINAHGTSTPLNDAMESKAIAEVFGNQIPVSSTKALTGHCLGAAAAIEAAFCCWSIDTHQAPAQLPQPRQTGEDIANIYLPTENVALKSSVAVSNSFAFGGNNVCLVFGRGAVDEPTT
ncbi:beta-ketoacyl-ACP synthase [Paraferrimonas sedimenticola]|uniref:Beta-ketoacyl-[acyl-carrier-protein] synthase II n=1 Tax=Paraferrimonas sedimenticola TaxID=375674 RepID=A0AA37RWL0_9GAMM|nr:beta-ketoacyl-ACP synthase [Paraferrimonas sedimenticola]GLP97040.1 beta-ketoacyl-[acyl-carrier-protein] synthase II [Paraferrimonas sedimenticola]